jgi:hypothetical protein
MSTWKGFARVYLMDAKAMALELGILGDLQVTTSETQNETQSENQQFATKCDFALNT